MKLPEKVIDMILQQSGIDINSPKSFYALSVAITEKTGDVLSENTLRRLTGVLNDGHTPHIHTLDIVAAYLGYAEWKSMMNELCPSNSSFSSNIDAVLSSDLKPGQNVELTYNPDRVIKLCYKGDNCFEAVSSINSKILEGDLLKVSGIAVHFPFIASEVIRDGVSLGRYIAGEEFGVSSIRVD